MYGKLAPYWRERHDGMYKIFLVKSMDVILLSWESVSIRYRLSNLLPVDLRNMKGGGGPVTP